jgi:hypothetical protein
MTQEATIHLQRYALYYAHLLWKKRYLEVLKGVNLDDPITLPHDQPDLHVRKPSDQLKELSQCSQGLRQALKNLAGYELDVRMAVRQTLLDQTKQDVVCLTQQYGGQLSAYMQRFETYLGTGGASSPVTTSLMLLMIARLGVIKDAADDKIEKKWEDWQEAQREFVKEQTTACQQDGESTEAGPSKNADDMNSVFVHRLIETQERERAYLQQTCATCSVSDCESRSKVLFGKGDDRKHTGVGLRT